MSRLKSEQKPGERLARFEKVWRELKASPDIVNLVRHGHRIRFLKKPPLSGPNYDMETKLPPVKMKVIREEIASLCAKGAMRKMSVEEAKAIPGHYSKMFCVPKPEKGAWRPVINLKPLNCFVDKRNFKMETVRDVRALLRPGQWGGTIDLKVQLCSCLVIQFLSGCLLSHFDSRGVQEVSSIHHRWTDIRVQSFGN